MYLPINIFLNRSSYYEELIVELFEIIRKKKDIYKKYDDFNDLTQIDGNDLDAISSLLNTEYEILNELTRGNKSSAEDFGFININERKL